MHSIYADTLTARAQCGVHQGGLIVIGRFYSSTRSLHSGSSRDVIPEIAVGRVFAHPGVASARGTGSP